MNKVVIITLLTVLMQLLVAQTKYYEKSVSFIWGQSAGEVTCINDSTLIVGCGGMYDSSSFEKIYLLFTDQFINNQTPVSYGSEYGDFVIREMIQTPNGFAISGWMNNGVEAPITNETYDHQFMMEVDHVGNLLNFYDLKEFPYQGDAICMHYYPETNTYYIGGEAFVSTMPTQMWLLKMTDGEVVWRNNYGTYSYRNTIQKLLPAPDGGVFAVADVDVLTGYHFGNYAIMKVNSNGISEWIETFSVGFEDRLTDCIVTNENGFLISGGSNLPNPINNNRLYATLLLLDSVRNTIWSKQYFVDSYRSEMVKCYQTGSDFICIGNVKYIDIFWQSFIMKIRGNDGEPLWTRFYDYGEWHDYFYNFTPVPQPLGGFVCVGRTEPVGGADVYIVKTNCMGLLTVPQAEFTIEQDPDFINRYLFTNQSQYAYPDSIDGGHYVWNWGDGSLPYICGQGYAPCTQDTLTHIYQAEGVYGVTLQAIVCNDTSTQIQSVCFGFSPNPQAAFTYTDFGGTIQFTNLSQNAYLEQGGQLSWDFGDGSPPSNTANPAHHYEENGSYTVTLTLVVCADTSVFSQEVVVQTVGLPPDISPPGPLKGEKTLQIYPNPAQNTLTFQRVSKSPSGGWGAGDLGADGTGDITITLYHLTGQVALQTGLAAGEASKTISVAHLPVGVYLGKWQAVDGSLAGYVKVAVVR